MNQLSGFATRADLEKLDEYVHDGFETVLQNIESVDQNVTKLSSHITDLRVEMRDGFKGLRKDIANIESNLKSEIISSNKQLLAAIVKIK